MRSGGKNMKEEKIACHESAFRGRGAALALVLILVISSVGGIVSSGGDPARFTAGDILVNYRMNEGSGQIAADSSGNGNDAFLGLSGDAEGEDPDWTEGINGTGLNFDGVNDLLMCSPFDFPATEFAIAFWVNIPDSTYDSFPVSYAVPGEDNEVLIVLRGDIHIEIDWPNEYYVSRDLRDGVWHHLVVTWQSSDGKIDVYIDGELEDSGTLSQGVEVVQGGALSLGYEQDEVGGGFEPNQGLLGSMDEFMILGKYIAGPEVEELYSSYMRPPSGLTAVPGSGFVDLSWNDVVDPDLDHYDIFRVDPGKMNTGLLGFYYDNPNLTDMKMVRVDDSIDFHWGDGAPSPGMGADDFSVSWRGYLKLEESGDQDIYLTYDDGARLWIDGELLIDDWDNSGEYESFTWKDMEAGYHSIRIDYREADMNAAVSLEIDGPHSPRMVVPPSDLFSFNMTDWVRISSVDVSNFRDSGLEPGIPNFYYVTYVRSDGGESGRSNITAASPSNPSTLIITPNELHTTLGAVLETEITVGNDGRYRDLFELSVGEPYTDWVDIDRPGIYLSPGQKVHLTARIGIPVDAAAGTAGIVVEMRSDLNGVVQSETIWVEISTDPVIRNLKPENGFNSGSMKVLFTWETDLEASTMVYLREKGESEYTEHIGESARVHMVNLSLEREREYEFYVRSDSSYGSASSEVRSFTVSTGIIFSESSYSARVRRDYDQHYSIRVMNIDERLHRATVSIDNPYDDIVIGFVGDGSTDRDLSLPPGTFKNLDLAIHTQDARNIEHRMILNLTTIPPEGEEAVHAFAVLFVKLDHVFVNLSVEEISSNPYTLEKRVRITNIDDTVTDLNVYADEEHASYINMEPAVRHGLLETDGSIEIDIFPQLHFAFVPFTATIYVSAFYRTYSIDLDFEPPEGWEVFSASVYPNWGGFPFVEIPDDDIDLDGIPNAEDPDSDGDGIENVLELFLSLDTDNDGIPNTLDIDDDGDGNPDVSDPWRIDFDNDWYPNYVDPDRDGDGIPNENDTYPDDLDNDGVNNGLDNDDDNDRIKDGDDYHPHDHDNDGENDDTDTDDDSDGVEDSSDSNPYDQDNDGTPDVSDGDWKGGGKADPKSNKWNPNPRPGGSPGSYGGGGGSDSTEGEDWYCTNKPELNLAELAVLLFDIGMILVKLGIALSGVGAATATAVALGSFLMSMIEGFATNAAKSGFQSMTGMNFHSAKVGAAQAALDWLGVGGSSGSRAPSRGLRENIGRFYENYAENTSRYPMTVMNEYGIHHVWQERRDEHVQLYYSRRDVPYSDPGPDIQLTNSSRDCSDPFLMTDLGGWMYIVWAENDGVSGSIKMMKRVTDTNWGNEITVYDSAGNVHDPQMIIDSLNRKHFVWVDDRDGNSELYTRYTRDFRTWSSPYRLTDTSYPSLSPEIGVDTYDNVHVVWSDGTGSSREIFHILSADRGASWGSVRQISDSGVDAGEPRLGITGGNVMHAAWRDSRHGESEIYYRKSTDLGVSWGDEERLTNDTSYSECPDLNILGEDLFLTWHDDRTGVDLTYFRVFNESSGKWSAEKRVPSGIPTLDKLMFEIEMHPEDEKKVKPHDLHIMLDDIEIGSLRDTIPDGRYIFEIPLDVLSAAAGAGRSGKLKLVSRHMNRGHYVVAANWKLTWHYTYDHVFVCAPDQYTADEYVRGNMSVQWTTEDPAIYANDMDISDPMPDLGDTVTVSAGVRNMGGQPARDVTVTFYEQEPGNASRIIGDPVVMDMLGTHEMKTVSCEWTTVRDVSRIYAVVDAGENDRDAGNNVEFVRVRVIVDEPPSGSIVINDGGAYTSSDLIYIYVEVEGANEVTDASFSNDNVSWSGWEPMNEYFGWYLGGITRGEDDERTVYARFRDVGGHVSDVVSASIGYYPSGPTIVSSSTSSMGPSGSMFFEFSNPMDEDSVRAAFLIDPEADGSFHWNGTVMFFDPSGELEGGRTYNVSINSSAFDFDGRKLERTYYFEFTIVEGGGEPSVNDTDGDGMPDAWEELHGLNKTDPSDASGDLDGDGISNLDEFRNGTDPNVKDETGGGGGGGSSTSSTLVAILVILGMILLMIAVIVIFIIASRNKEEGWEEE